jgi:hypothetical protein
VSLVSKGSTELARDAEAAAPSGVEIARSSADDVPALDELE